MTVNELGAIAGVILSLALAYLPKIKEWYEPKPAEDKARIMGALLVIAAVGVFVAGCINAYTLVPCTADGAKDLVSVLISALMANQASYLLLVKPYQN